MDKQFKWLKIFCVALGIIGIAFTISVTPSTMSYFLSQDTVANLFELSEGNIEIEENFEQPTDDNPWYGGKWDKTVQITNLGTEQSLIRVSIIPRWENADGTPFAGDTSLLDIEFTNLATTPGWIEGEDDYFYYNQKIPAGAMTIPIMASVTFNQESISTNIVQRYGDKILIIDVEAEAVHANQLAYEAVWSQVASSNSAVDQMLENLIATP